MAEKVSGSDQAANLLKQAENSICDSEALHKTILLTSMEGYWMVDMQGCLVEVNGAYCRMSGYTQQELLSMCISDLEAAEEPSDTALHLQKVMTQGEDRFESRHRRKDGKIIEVEISIKYLPFDGGRIVAFLRDITECRKWEDALRRSEKRFRKLIQNSRDILVILDENGIVRHLSDAVESITGYKPEECLGKLCFDYVHPDDMNKVIEKFKEILANPGATKREEYRHRHKNGGWVQLEAIGANLLNDETVEGIVLNVRDITKRKQDEAALQESEIRFRQLADATWEGILIHRDGILLDGNQALFDMFGYKTAEAIGRSILDFIDPEYTEKIVQRLKETTQTSILHVEGKGRKKDGTVFPIEALGRPITHNNLPARVTAVRDLTERIGAEQKLQNTLASLRKAVSATVQVLVTAVETRDPYTAGHQNRSAALAHAIATEMGLSQDKIDGIGMAGSIHDIGKLSIPAEILSKPTNLTEIEFPLIKEHAKKGYEMLKDVESPWPLAEMVYQHHERMDGSGYPRGLKGEEILIESRILAVADVVESMASHRPYRPALGLDAALEEIENNKGTLYDADAVDACLRLFREKGYQLALR